MTRVILGTRAIGWSAMSYTKNDFLTAYVLCLGLDPRSTSQRQLFAECLTEELEGHVTIGTV